MPSSTPGATVSHTLLRDHGLQPGDHYSILMENNDRYLESCGAGERSGLYYTCINSYLTAEEVAYIVDNSDSQVLITSPAKRQVALDAARTCPKLTLVLVVDEPGGSDDDRVRDFDEIVSGFPGDPIPDERLGTPMLYSSGTTGRPKGIVRPLPDQPPGEMMPLFQFLTNLWHYREDMTYLSPAPLYHSAPQAAVNLTIRIGGDRDHHGALRPGRVPPPDRAVPGHPHPARADDVLAHAQAARRASGPASTCRRSRSPFTRAAPCPVQVKQQMIEWWGPIIHEYYGATEGLGFTACDSEEWLAHKGTVGKVMLGDLHILDDDMNELPMGQPGTIWFKTATAFEYHNDPQKTTEATSPDGTMTTVGDVGYVDDGRLPVPHRPQDVHDHLRRREHLPAGDRRTC